MEVLQELVFLIGKNKKRGVELLNVQEDSNLFRLFQGVLNNEFLNDADAYTALFKTQKQDQNYQKLKHSLKSRLLDCLFLIDLNEPHYNDRQKAYYECYKNWAIVKILLGKDARNSAITISHNILRQAQRFEFSELVMDISRILRLHYGTRKGNLKKYEQYNALFQKYERLWMMENRAEMYYTELVLNYVNSKATKPELEEMAAKFYEEIVDYLEEGDSYRLRFSLYFIHLNQHMSKNDYEKSIEIAEEAIEYFESKDYQATTPILIFAYQLLVCFTQLKKYEAGRKIVELCQGMVNEGSFNWFKFQENYFLLAMHSEQYQEAYRILLQTFAHPRFTYLPAPVIEVWKIFEAYTHYLILVNKIELKDGEAPSSFKLNKFLNEIPIYSKDKRGLNISILVIQILFLVLNGRYELAANRIDSVRKYAYRYLTKDHTYRSNCFIKMLCKLPSAHYHKVAVSRKAGDLLKKLYQVPLEVANQAHDVEVIPYEQLWEFTLLSLDSSFHRAHLKRKKTV